MEISLLIDASFIEKKRKSFAVMSLNTTFCSNKNMNNGFSCK